MPIACNTSTSTLTGQEGSIYFKPAGTAHCLLDNTDFPAGTSIPVPSGHDYRVGDAIVFTVEGTAKLDTALTAGTTYYVVATTATSISVSATLGGSAITLKGDGGLGASTGGVVSALTATPALPTTSGGYGTGPYTGIATTTTGTGSGLTVNVTVASNNVTAVAVNAGGTGYKAGDTITVSGALLGGASPANDITLSVTTASAITGGGNTAGAANHISVEMASFQAVCQVREFSVSIERETLDTTTLPCGVGAGGGKFAAFRSEQAGFASGSGSMTVYFTDSQTSLANRLLGNVLLRSQQGAEVKLYVSTVSDGAGGVNDAASLYIESEISLTSMSLSVNPSDPTSAEISFSLRNPKKVFGATIV